MLSMRAGAVALVVSGLSVGTAAAADIFVEPELAPEERIEEGWKVAITPRFWYFWENDVYFQVDNTTFQQSNRAVDIPFAGASISLTPPGLGGTTFSLTGMYGEGTGDVFGNFQAGVFGGIAFPAGGRYIANVEISRLDFEAIAQIPIAEGVTGIVGGRFIRFDRDEAGAFIGPGGAPVVPAAFFVDQQFYLGELGVGVTRPAWDRTVFFGNATAMIGYADLVDTNTPGGFGVFNVPNDALEGGVFGIDTNAGMGVNLTPNMLLSGRYRLFALTNPDFVFDEGGTFIHGPEVNLTISFGG